LSSAILYVAIVAIWAGVLIPRWLRRDSAASEQYSEDLTTAETEVEAEPAPPPRRRDATPPARREEPTAPRAPARSEARAETRSEARSEARAETRSEARSEARAEARAETRAEARPEPRTELRTETRAGVPDVGPRDEEHKKVLAARRRLLYMLLVLAIGSGALAFAKMAAWWVMVPPTIMLLGYMGLLREAAKADTERRELARTRVTAAAAVAAARRETAPAPVPAPAPPAPDAEVIDISASLTSAGQEFFDQYADAKLRAVGDLAFAMTG
jgi:hypothetical protein